MTNMDDLFEGSWSDRFESAINNGLITVRFHPDFPELAIANYTSKAAYEGAWDDITLTSRGLIFNAKTGDVLARPFKKFFNYGQTGAPEIALNQKLYHVANKFDGSLGIGYIRPDGRFAIATRGSFDSEQARHANKVLAENPSTYYWYRGDASVGYTPLFEIIYPENRIVLDYGDKDYLQFLGWIEVKYGKYMPPGTESNPWGHTFGSVLDREPRTNAEGWVVWLDQYTAVKIKQDDYVALHKIVTGLNEKEVWRQLQQGPEPYAKFIWNLPDELQQWAVNVGFALAVDYSTVVREIDDWYIRASEVAWDYSEGHDSIPRKNFALAVQDSVPAKFRGFMFSLADGKDIQDKVWKLLEPKGVTARPRVLEDA